MTTPDNNSCVPALLGLAKRIEAKTGLDFGSAKGRTLEIALNRMAGAAGFEDQVACSRWLTAEPWSAAKNDLCARFLTVGETYFFREPRAFDLMCDYARRLVQTQGIHRAPLRIWSAGCCTGEEPYSMAIALRQRVPGLAADKVEILATDISNFYLDTARAGVYRKWSFRNAASGSHAAFFAPAAENFVKIDASIRAQVRFAQLNLALPGYPSAESGTQALDIIFCRNVMMYFSPARMKQVIARLRACLVEDGWLIVNPSEASSELFEGFRAVYFPDAVYFQKISGELPDSRFASAQLSTYCPPPRDSVAEATPLLAIKGPGVSLNQVGARARSDTLAHAQLLVGAGKPGAALQTLKRAIEAEPMMPQPYEAAVKVAIELGEFTVAKNFLKSLLYLQPDNVLARYLSAIVDTALGSCTAARRQLLACHELLASASEHDTVPGADGWPAIALRESVKGMLERAR